MVFLSSNTSLYFPCPPPCGLFLINGSPAGELSYYKKTAPATTGTERNISVDDTPNSDTNIVSSPVTVCKRQAVFFIPIFERKGDTMAKAKYTKGADGYFSTKIWDGTYTKDGKKHLKNLRTKKSSKALEDLVADFKAQVADRKNTRKMYDNIIEKHLIALDGVRLQDIDRIHLQIVLNNAADKKRTQQQILLTFKQIMKSAVTDQLFPANVFEMIFQNAETVRYTPKEKRALSEDEKKSVFKADFSTSDKIFVYLLYGCGLRRGEALALTIFDINTKKREITINKSHEFSSEKSVLKSPKSANGYRTVPIPEKIFPDVEKYVDYLKSKNKTYLFTMRNGQPVTKSSYDKMWKRIVSKLQEVCDEPITGLTAHVVLHNYCTNLCYQIPTLSIKRIAQLLGDTKKMVLEVYNHIVLEKEDAVSAVDAAVNF